MFVAYSNLTARSSKIERQLLHHQIDQIDFTTIAIARLQESINDIFNKNLEKVKEDIKTLNLPLVAMSYQCSQKEG